MRMNSAKGDLDFELYPGLAFRGKWNRKPYKLIRKLGAGVTGYVYLAEGETGSVALKIGTEPMSITAEANVLKQFSKVQGKPLGPCLFDVDDFLSTNSVLPFYAMEYIEGENFVDFLRGKGPEWLPVLALQLLSALSALHQQGWVFGDLKPENVIVTRRSAEVRLLDVGGTTRVGRAIKEYTEYYDRGYWEQGTRKAEPTYDLFAAAMMVVDCAYPRQVKKERGNTASQLKKLVYQAPLLKPYREIVYKALMGGYGSAEAMKNDFLASVKQTEERGRVKRKQQHKVRKQKGAPIDLILVMSFVLILFVLYLLIQSF
ncbi:protein kinase domain-containing protein [Shouchella clausii]|uniref:protein kinase domain-containing protein n=1 Tax=Shouchella clausii TaxID=79880 RepID=UPI003F8851C2